MSTMIAEKGDSMTVTAVQEPTKTIPFQQRKESTIQPIWPATPALDSDELDFESANHWPPQQEIEIAQRKQGI